MSRRRQHAIPQRSLRMIAAAIYVTVACRVFVDGACAAEQRPGPPVAATARSVVPEGFFSWTAEVRRDPPMLAMPDLELGLFACTPPGIDADAVMQEVLQVAKMNTVVFSGWPTDTRTVRSCLQQLVNAKGVETVVLDGVPLDAAGLECLLQIRNLRGLQIYGETAQRDASRPVAIGDWVLPSLSQLTSLESLSLSDTSVTGQGIGCLSNLRGLRRLTLNGNKIDDTTIGELAWLRTLAHLDLAGTAVTARGVAQLRELPRLTSLSLSRFDRDMAVVASRLPVLEELTVYVDDQSTAGLVDVGQLRRLRRLAIDYGGAIPTEVMEAISRMESLHELWLRYLDSDDLRLIGKCRNLRKLSVTGLVRPRDIQCLGDCELLEELTIDFRGFGSGGSHQTIDVEEVACLQRMKKLRSLTVRHAVLTPQAWRYAGKLTKVEHLDLPDAVPPGTPLDALIHLKRLRSLTLNLPAPSALRMAAILPNLKSLQTMDIGEATTDEAQALLPYLPAGAVLRFSGAGSELDDFRKPWSPTGEGN